MTISFVGSNRGPKRDWARSFHIQHSTNREKQNLHMQLRKTHSGARSVTFRIQFKSFSNSVGIETPSTRTTNVFFPRFSRLLRPHRRFTIKVSTAKTGSISPPQSYISMSTYYISIILYSGITLLQVRRGSMTE